MQIQYWRDHVYVGHLFSGGFSVIDVKDPNKPTALSVEEHTRPYPYQAANS